MAVSSSDPLSAGATPAAPSTAGAQPATDSSVEDPAPAAAPGGILGALARAVTGYPKTVLLVAILVTVWCGVEQGDLSTLLSGGGFTSKDTESALGQRTLSATVRGGSPNLVLIAPYDASPEGVKAGSALHDRIEYSAGVDWAQSYWDNQDVDLRSTDGKSVALLVRLSGNEDEAAKAASILVPAWQHDSGIPLRASGEAAVDSGVVATSDHDLLLAERIGIPLTAAILLLVLGSPLLVLLPITVGAVSVLISNAILEVIARNTEVSQFALNITTALGFGLAVDYCLLLVNRYREELGHTMTTRLAAARSVASAGRTILFSAVTVSCAMSALLVFPIVFLSSLAYAAIPVVLAAALVSITVLPALLVLFPKALFRFDLRALTPQVWRRGGLWRRWANAVMAHPIIAGVPVVAALLSLATPVLGAQVGLSDWHALPASAPARQASAQLESQFPELYRAQIDVAVIGAREVDVKDFADRLSAMPGVHEVDSLRGKHRNGNAYYARKIIAPPTDRTRLAELRRVSRVERHQPTRGTSPKPDRQRNDVDWLSVKLDSDRYSAPARQIVRAIRAGPQPGQTLVGGDTADLVDTMDLIHAHLATAAGIIAASTLVLLFLFTGSVLIPLKALAMNLLSLAASFGTMVYVFEQGHLKWLVGDFTTTGYVDVTIVVLLFCLAFGLSMDYEIFLLSRIREFYDETGDNKRAVAMGLEKTGKLFTAAALVIACALGALATSQLAALKLLGAGIVVAILLDAVLVRAILVPAFMHLAGQANWWAPQPLRAIHTRLGGQDGGSFMNSTTEQHTQAADGLPCA